MPVRTKRLFAGTSPAANTLAVVYTGPADETTIVKDIRIYSESAAPQLARILLRSGAADVFIVYNGLNQASLLALSPWIVLMPGDQILLLSDQFPGFRVWISGTQLEGVAD